MYCGQCGTSNPEDAINCEACGALLVVSPGARSCTRCGAQIGDNDRFCTSCGTEAFDADAGARYDADDDFGELDIDEIQIDDLPDWLQGMAPSSPAPQPRPSSPDQPSPDDLPDWLRETSSEPDVARAPSSPPTPAREQSPVDHQPADQFSLVSDEDLPEWLRALADEEEGRTAQPEPTPTPTPARVATPVDRSAELTTAVANLFEVPPVSRAWQSRGRTIDQGQVAAAREGFMPLDVVSGIRSHQEGPRNIWDTDQATVPIDTQETRPLATAEESSSAGRSRLIIRIVILALIIIVAILLAIVLLQGI